MAHASRTGFALHRVARRGPYHLLLALDANYALRDSLRSTHAVAPATQLSDRPERSSEPAHQCTVYT